MKKQGKSSFSHHEIGTISCRLTIKIRYEAQSPYVSTPDIKFGYEIDGKSLGDAFAIGEEVA
jgi:hypothetical protein